MNQQLVGLESINNDVLRITAKFLDRVEFKGTSAIELARLINLTKDPGVLKQNLDERTLKLLISALESSSGFGSESLDWVHVYTVYIAIYEQNYLNQSE
jgi:hypothetical protein